MMNPNDPPRGLATAKVTTYERVIRCDLRYAIPALLMLVVFVLTFFWAAGILVFSWSTLQTLKHTYNQTSPGRLATSLLLPGRSDPQQSSKQWAQGDGKLILSFGRVGEQVQGHFCRLKGHDALLDQKGMEVGADPFEMREFEG
jgi:hypothetical protein